MSHATVLINYNRSGIGISEARAKHMGKWGIWSCVVGYFRLGQSAVGQKSVWRGKARWWCFFLVISRSFRTNEMSNHIIYDHIRHK